MNAKHSVKNVVYSDFYCQECQSKIVLPRKRHRQRNLSHIKDIYCINCHDVTKHYEVRFNDFTFLKNKGAI